MSPLELEQVRRASSSKLSALRDAIASCRSALVAFSAGVDSTLVVAVAHEVLGDRAVALTAHSPSVPAAERAEARDLAARVGIRHLEVVSHEQEDPRYVANDVDRCYHCKTELYDVLMRVAGEREFPVVVSGANVDDLGDYRPGLRAAAEHGIRHPLVETGFAKDDVRAAARELGIPTWDKPASACLSSRIAFGERITVGELTRVGRAERLLKQLGFATCRVRVHGDLARVEVDASEIARLAEPAMRDRVVSELRELGYRYVTLDLEGFRSGSMNPPEADADGAR